jgi:hypothetical protein
MACFQNKEKVAPASGRLFSGVTPETVGRSYRTIVLDLTRQSLAHNPAGRLFHHLECTPQEN